MMNVLFDEMKDGDRAQRWCDGLVAEKVMDSLIWIEGQDEQGEVRAYSVLNDQWELVKKGKDKKIGIEQWMESNDPSGTMLRYEKPGSGRAFLPCEVMAQKTFLRWVGAIPEGNKWPGRLWCIWIRDDLSKVWSPEYSRKDGFTVNIFANYAEMRVEK